MDAEIGNATLISTRDAAGMLGVGVSTLNLWAQTGRIKPAIEAPGIRGPRFYTVEAVEALAEERAK